MAIPTTPSISVQPGDLTICSGQPASFSVTADGAGLTYQWRRNTVPIDGATSSTYSITGTLASQAGTYDVLVGSSCAGPVLSQGATLTVQTPPHIDVPPASQTVCYGQPVQLSVVAAGTNVNYQWRKNGQSLDGETASTYAIPFATSTHAGNYDVVLTGTCGSSVTSALAVVTVNTQPAIASFTPLSGTAGTPVAIAGSGFAGVTAVTFNGTPASFTVEGDTLITATVPAGATSGPLSVTKGGCSTATSSGGFAVLGGFGAPAGLLATAISTSQIFISWSAVGGAHHYELWRRAGGSPFSMLAEPIGSAFFDSTCGSGAACAYEVRAVDASGTMSAFSNVDLATTIMFTDDPLVAGVTTIKAAHWLECRAAVNAVRAAAGFPAAEYSDSVLAGTVPKALHLAELRAALDPARAVLGVPPLSYGEPAAPGYPVRASHLSEIRSGVK
jgi:hypothetical protein